MADDPHDIPEIPPSIIIDPEKLDDIRIVLALPKLGELIAHVAHQFAALRGIDPPALDGEEMRALAIGGWKHVMHMADREHFVASIEQDLAALEQNPFPLVEYQASSPQIRDIPPDPRPPEPEHKSEFGL